MRWIREKEYAKQNDLKTEYYNKKPHSWWIWIPTYCLEFEIEDAVRTIVYDALISLFYINSSAKIVTW